MMRYFLIISLVILMSSLVLAETKTKSSSDDILDASSYWGRVVFKSAFGGLIASLVTLTLFYGLLSCCGCASQGITSRKDPYTSKYKSIYYDPDIEAAERSGKREFRDLFTLCYVFFTWIMFGFLIGWFITPKCDADGKN